MLQISEMLRTFEEHHVHGLTEERRLLVLGRALGMNFRRLGIVFSRSESSARREIEHIQDGIFVPLALDRDTWATGLWCALHRDCCLSSMFEKNIETKFA